MDKLGFWVMVAVAAIIGIWVFKFAASQSNVRGLKDFASAI